MSAGAISAVWPIRPHPHALENAAELSQRQIDVEAGDGLQLVQRAAGVAEPAPADHGDGHAGCGNHRGNDERRLVADAARGMFVDLRARNVGEIKDFAGVQHRASEGAQFRAVHSPDEHSHQPGGHLIVGNFVLSIGTHKKVDFVA